jgi:serine/threonine-protein phosphatase 5
MMIMINNHRLDPRYIKAYYRRGSANFALNKLKLALKDFKAVAKMVPTDGEAVKRMKACDKAIKEDAFMKAIESEDMPEVAIDIDAIIVDDSYTGPRLDAPSSILTETPISPDSSSKSSSKEISEPDLVISPEFVRDVKEYFKAQKRLHRKYVIQVLQAAIKHFSKAPSLLQIALPGKELPTGKIEVCSFPILGILAIYS